MFRGEELQAGSQSLNFYLEPNPRHWAAGRRCRHMAAVLTAPLPVSSGQSGDNHAWPFRNPPFRGVTAPLKPPVAINTRRGRPAPPGGGLKVEQRPVSAGGRPARFASVRPGSVWPRSVWANPAPGPAAAPRSVPSCPAGCWSASI